MNQTFLSILLLVMLFLSACNSSNSTASNQTAASGNSASPATLQAAQAQHIRLQVVPAIGVPDKLSPSLVEALQQQARQRGITLAGSSTTGATHILKGYLSVLNEDDTATIIYVWDIYDPSGNRLHRISGQQKTEALNGAQGWPGIAPAALGTISATSMDQLFIWFQTSTNAS